MKMFVISRSAVSPSPACTSAKMPRNRSSGRGLPPGAGAAAGTAGTVASLIPILLDRASVAARLRRCASGPRTISSTDAQRYRFRGTHPAGDEPVAALDQRPGHVFRGARVMVLAGVD